VLDDAFNGYSWGHMSGYNDTPPTDGVTEYAEAIPANGTIGLQFNLRRFPAATNQERAITWEYEFPNAPSAVSLSLVGSLRPWPTSEYVVIDTGTNLAGEVRAVPQDKIAGFRFLAIQVNSSTAVSLVLALASVVTSVSGSAVYTGTITGGAANAYVGLTFVINGFQNPSNNGTFIATASSATTLTLLNANAVAETFSAVATTGVTPYNTSSVAAATSTAVGPLSLTNAETAVGANTTYEGTITGGAQNAYAGVLFTVAGFVTTPANNGTYVCVASTTSTLTLANSGGFAEAHPATASGTQNSAVYTGTYTGGASNAFAGLIFTVTGFTNAANNGVFYASASTATTLTLSNANAVAEVASAVLYTGLPESIIAKISG
jgi:hypothetical protein